MLNNDSAFNNDHYLGQVTKVTASCCIIHIPNSALLKTFWLNGQEYSGGIVGQYVVVEGQRHGFLAMIQEIELPDRDIRILEQDNTKESKDTSYHPNARIELLLSFDFYSMEVQKGLGRFPIVGARAYLCDKGLLQDLLNKAALYSSKGEDTFLRETAILQSDETIIATLSPQGIFERHCAILGTTGGGKSYTVAKLIEGLLNEDGNYKLVLVDPTGEYDSLNRRDDTTQVAFGKDGSDDSVFLSYRNLSIEDLTPLFRPAPQTQKPKLIDAIKHLKLLNHLIKNITNSDLVSDIEEMQIKANDLYLKVSGKKRSTLIRVEKKFSNEIYEDNNDYDIEQLPMQIWLECVRQGDGDTYGAIEPKEQGYVASLVSRIHQVIKNPHFNKVFNFSNSDGNSIYSELEKFMAADNKKLFIISMKDVVSDLSLRELVVNAIGRKFLEMARNSKFKSKPVILFLDEAHLFLKKTIKDNFVDDVELDAFEKIAKECRKHGLYLCLSTQMPRDIPDGILSQMGSFLVHRLINNTDIEKVRYACPEASRSLLSYLPALGPGEALFVSISMPMPIILKMNPPTLKPNSTSPKLFG